MTAIPKAPETIRTERRRFPGPVGLVSIACMWPKKGENLGTLARTVDAIGGRLIVPATTEAARALRRGDTIGYEKVVDYWSLDPDSFLPTLSDLAPNSRIVGVELAHSATLLADLDPATGATMVVLGHESRGIPGEQFQYLHEVVEIPMLGVGSSLNVAVAGSLVAYKLAGLS